VTDPASGGSVLLAGLGGLSFAAVAADRVAFRLLIEGGPTFIRPNITLAAFGTIHEPAQVIGRAVFGIEVRFP
jgi:hypothetical protein